MFRHYRNSRAVCALWAAVLLAAGCAPLRAPEPPTGPHFSALTWNVNWGGPGRREALEILRAADADIVCLQETNPAWEAYLTPELKRKYRFVKFRHAGGAGGLAILSRFPVQEVFFGRTRAGWFPKWVVKVETPVGAVQVVNVHLRPPLAARGGVSIRTWFRTREVRKEEVREIFGKLRPSLPVLFMGDFNEHEDGRACGWLRAKGMTDALSEFDRDTDTWEWDTGRWWLGTLEDRFDHILYSPPLYALDARVIKKGKSDHFPVLAVFEKRERPAPPP